MKFVIPVESIFENKGGVILYNPITNEIEKQYVHDKEWIRVGWRGGKLYGDYLIATDWNELHFFNVRKWQYEKSFSKNTFNDLHYIEINNDKLYVVNTGLDAIEVFNNPMDPEFEEIIFVFEKNKDIFDQRKINLNRKYNTIKKYKPHMCHPNCIAFDRKRIFVTCFEKRHKGKTGEVIELNTGKRLFKNRCFDCHDGIFHGNDYYLTNTRYQRLLIYKDLKNKSLPQVPTKQVRFSRARVWWRGMVIVDNVAYMFGSDGYKNKPSRIRTTRVQLDKRSKPRKITKLPSIGGVNWDTVYQPNLWEK